MTKAHGSKPAPRKEQLHNASNLAPTDCLCPMCRSWHVLNIFWTGVSVPRFFCASCARKVSRLGTFAEAPGEDIIRSTTKSPKDYLASQRIAEVAGDTEEDEEPQKP